VETDEEMSKPTLYQTQLKISLSWTLFLSYTFLAGDFPSLYLMYLIVELTKCKTMSVYLYIYELSPPISTPVYLTMMNYHFCTTCHGLSDLSSTPVPNSLVSFVAI